MPKPNNKYIYTEYQKLHDLLTANKWKKADKQTTRIILKLVDKDRKGSMTIDDIKKIPSKDIRKIDSMWNSLSGGQFGLSVQKDSYSKIDGSYRFKKESWSKFARSVGWLKKFWFDPFKQKYYPETKGNLPFNYLTKVKYKMSFSEICQHIFAWFIMLICGLLLPVGFLVFLFVQPIAYPIRKIFSKRLYKPWYTFAQHLSN